MLRLTQLLASGATEVRQRHWGRTPKCQMSGAIHLCSVTQQT